MTSAPHAVRRLGVADAPVALDALLRLKVAEPDPSLSLEYLRRFLSRDENVLLVACAADEPIGFLLAYVLDRVDRDRPMVCLYEIDVAEAYRRAGVGRGLVNALAAVCGGIGTAEVWTVTNRSNGPAVGLFESMGWTAPAIDDVVYETER